MTSKSNIRKMNRFAAQALVDFRQVYNSRTFSRGCMDEWGVATGRKSEYYKLAVDLGFHTQNCPEHIDFVENVIAKWGEVQLDDTPESLIDKFAA